ncbi:MAG: FKBP-type peptidyl-prolyl cis-trans isomerase N-terminal domain-containing protein, partial [Daejeonella sp.]
MNALKFTLITALLPFSVLAQNKMSPEKISSPPVVMKTSMDSCSYAMGMSIATDLKARGVNELNYDLFAKALVDGFAGTNTLFSKEEMQKAISNYLSKAKKSQADGVLAEGEKFLAENKVKKGVITLPSGLQYLVLKPGTGAKPKVKDDVTVHYEGKLLNGFKFDSSYDRKEPIDLNLSQVIPGWT